MKRKIRTAKLQRRKPGPDGAAPLIFEYLELVERSILELHKRLDATIKLNDLGLNVVARVLLLPRGFAPHLSTRSLLKALIEKGFNFYNFRTKTENRHTKKRT